MNSLLGNYLSSNDLIVVHLCGNGKDLKIKKTQEYLGLTITDNGFGRAFVKKVKSDQPIVEQMIKPGDHIAAIDSESTIGMRHYQVAKAIRNVPQDKNFTIHLIEPLSSSDNFIHIDDDDSSPKDSSNHEPIEESLLNFARTTNRTMSNRVPPRGNISLELNTQESTCEELIHSSIPIDRLLSKSNGAEPINTIHADKSQDSYRSTIDRINATLESFLGINDNLLAIRIYRLAKENEGSYSQFASAIKTSELSLFNFGEDIKTFLWNCATGVID